MSNKTLKQVFENKYSWLTIKKHRDILPSNAHIELECSVCNSNIGLNSVTVSDVLLSSSIKRFLSKFLENHKEGDKHQRREFLAHKEKETGQEWVSGAYWHHWVKRTKALKKEYPDESFPMISAHGAKCAPKWLYVCMDQVQDRHLRRRATRIIALNEDLQKAAVKAYEEDGYYGITDFCKKIKDFAYKKHVKEDLAETLADNWTSFEALDTLDDL